MKHTVFVLQRAIAAVPLGSVILVDGFPRSVEQAQTAEKALGPPVAVLYFDCSEETMKVGDTCHQSLSCTRDQLTCAP